MKHSVVIDINGVATPFGKGAVVNVSDAVYADNWQVMEWVDAPLHLKPKVVVYEEPKPDNKRKPRVEVYETAAVDRKPRTRKKVKK